MKSLKEVGPPELDAIKRRAIRDLAMDRITPRDCDIVTTKIDDLIGFIHNMQEEGEET